MIMWLFPKDCECSELGFGDLFFTISKRAKYDSFSNSMSMSNFSNSMSNIEFCTLKKFFPASFNRNKSPAAYSCVVQKSK